MNLNSMYARFGKLAARKVARDAQAPLRSLPGQTDWRSTKIHETELAKRTQPPFWKNFRPSDRMPFDDDTDPLFPKMVGPRSGLEIEEEGEVSGLRRKTRLRGSDGRRCIAFDAGYIVE